MRVLMVAAVACFLIALLGELGVLAGVAVLAWALDLVFGGFVWTARQ